MKNIFGDYEKFGEQSRFYFGKFPYIDYDILGDDEKKKIRNIFKRFDFRENIRKYGSIFTKWILRDDDTPEIIAHKLYGSTHYFWIVLMINKMFDPYFDFPMQEDMVHAYTEKKYGVENIHRTHHYESEETADPTTLPAGIIVDETYPHRVAISNLDHEIKMNDSRREILLLNPEYLEDVLAEFNTIMESGFQYIKPKTKKIGK